MVIACTLPWLAHRTWRERRIGNHGWWTQDGSNAAGQPDIPRRPNASCEADRKSRRAAPASRSNHKQVTTPVYGKEDKFTLRVNDYGLKRIFQRLSKACSYCSSMGEFQGESACPNC